MKEFLNALTVNRFITEMLFSCLLIMLPHRKRKYFLFRIFLVFFSAELISFFLMNVTSAKDIWQAPSNVVLSCCIHFVVFVALSLGCIWFCCPFNRQELIYGSALCLCIQHFSSALYLMLEILFPDTVWLAALLWFVSLIVPGCTFYYLFIRPICKNGAYELELFNLTLATCLIFLTSSVISTLAQEMNRISPNPLFLITQIYGMLCCLFLLWVQVNQKNALQLQRQLNIQEYTSHLRIEQSQQSADNMKLITHLMHELKHQIADFLTEEDTGVKEELLDQISDSLQVYDETYHTENEILNTVLMEQKLYCRANHIEWMVVADGKQLDFISDVDLYLILRNILDNAIESVVKIEDFHRRIIDIRIYTRNRFVVIQTENDFEGMLQFDDGLPLTTKEDKLYHGFGLRTVRDICEKYHGQLTIRVTEQHFSLQALIPQSQ